MVEEEEPKEPTKIKDQIKHDKELAQILDAQLQAEMEKGDRLARQREEEDNIVSWDNAQAIMGADYQMAERLHAEEQASLSDGNRYLLKDKNKPKRTKPSTEWELRARCGLPSLIEPMSFAAAAATLQPNGLRETHHHALSFDLRPSHD
ncbi:hypothetical protein Tco_0703069 [Tanacetum coccineum]|uniref:Uncharacterized protein n=1 Tax=Tanacetum coccineum TaxID=301880 RepID=A0ABQ4XXU4_9ASTR